MSYNYTNLKRVIILLLMEYFIRDDGDYIEMEKKFSKLPVGNTKMSNFVL
jgi:hypothetical protein